MTAAGKINASNATAGDRILVDTAVRAYPGDEIGVSRTKTGATTEAVRILAKHKVSNRRGYVIETGIGSFYAEPIQTMILAPEDAAGIKRAHAEAKAEDEARTAAAPAVTEVPAETETAAKLEAQVAEAQTVGQVNEAGNALGDAWSAGDITTEDFDRINAAHAAQGQRIALAEATARREAYARTHHLGPDATAGLHKAAAEVAAEADAKMAEMTAEVDAHTEARTARCDNPWHTTAPARARKLCPECPDSVELETAQRELAEALDRWLPADAVVDAKPALETLARVAQTLGRTLRPILEEGVRMARDIPEGRRRHGQIKARRDALRHAAKLELAGI